MFVFIFAIFGLILFYNYYWKRKDLPPGLTEFELTCESTVIDHISSGPSPLPIIGNLIELSKKPPGYEILEKWRKKYGNVYTYWVSEMPIVAVADYQTLNETFIKDGEAYAGRATMGNYHIHVKGGEHGIVSVEGDLAAQHRRFVLTVFRNFGMGKSLMEEKIICELDNMIDSIHHHLNSQNKIAINLIPIFEVTVSNIINQMLFGFSYHGEEKKKEFSKYKDVIARHMRMMLFPGVLLGLTFIKTFRYLPYIKEQMDVLYDDYKTITDYCMEQVDKHRNEMESDEYDYGNEPKDYVEAYLREAKKDPNSTFTNIQLKNALFDLWLAGQETTANTLIFSVLYLLHNPYIQEKLHKELDAVIGCDRKVTTSDKNSLIYLNAFICEVQRSVNLLPQNLLHKTTKDVQVGNYFIKKGTIIIPQISSVLYDKKVFPNPQIFDPERFLDENGQLKKVDELIPFSIGKRQCLGESLAKMELFLLVANFYNLFKVSPIDPKNIPSLEKTPGITIQPKPYECIIEKRY